MQGKMKVRRFLHFVTYEKWCLEDKNKISSSENVTHYLKWYTFKNPLNKLKPKIYYYKIYEHR